MSAGRHNHINVNVKWVEENLFVGSDEEGHSVVFDSALSATPGKKAPAKGIGPMKTLLAALGACSGMDVAAILAKRKQKLGSLSVEVSGKRPRVRPPKALHRDPPEVPSSVGRRLRRST